MRGMRGESDMTWAGTTRKLLTLTVAVVVLFAVTAAAASASTYWGYVNSNKSGVASGVQADTNATARHQSAENYSVRMMTSAGDAYLVWALAKDAGQTTFQPRVYLKYKTAADNPYNPSSRYHTLYYNPSSFTGWHELKLARNTGTYWKVYVDGVIKDWYVDWPYYTGSYASTYAEGNYTTGSPGQYLNHTGDFWTLQSGTWYRNNSPGEPGSGVTSPYIVYYLYPYYDWMGKQ